MIPVEREVFRLRCIGKLENHDKSLFTQGELNYLLDLLCNKEEL